MANRYYTEQDVRNRLDGLLQTTTQRSIAQDVGIAFQNVSLVKRGAPIPKKLLEYLGFERVENLYRKKAEKEPVK